MNDQLVGIGILIFVLGAAAIIFHPFFIRRRKTFADLVAGGITAILLVPAILYVGLTFFALRMDVPLIISVAFLIGLLGLFYGFKRRR